MGKKRSGHYCIRCSQYRTNEKFSGKGHKQHICKNCKRKGKANDPIIEVEGNPYQKQLKVKLKANTEYAGYIFFDINGKKHVIYDFDEITFETFSYIYKYNKQLNPPFELTKELNDNMVDILEVLLIKTENKYERPFLLNKTDVFTKKTLMNMNQVKNK